jgi:hypothetical protein
VKYAPEAAHPPDVLGYPAPSSDKQVITKLVLQFSGKFRHNIFAPKVLLGCQPSGHEMSGLDLVAVTRQTKGEEVFRAGPLAS